MIYKLEIFNKSGQLIADLSDRPTTRQIVKKINDFDVIKVEFDLDNIVKYCQQSKYDVFELFSVNQNELRISRDNKVISSGLIVDMVVTADSGDKRTIALTANGWFFLLSQRFTPFLSYTGDDAADVCWNMISVAQAVVDGDMGITRGLHPATEPIENDYNMQNIHDGVQNLAQATPGFDFEVTWDKVFNIFYPWRGNIRKDVTFTYPGKILSMSFNRDGTQMVNSEIGVGASSSTDSILETYLDDGNNEAATSQSRYGLKEKINNQSSLGAPDILLSVIKGDVNLLRNYMDLPTIMVDGNTDPEFGSYDVGDIITLSTQADTVFNVIQGQYRIEEIDCSIDENNYESVTLTLAPPPAQP